MNYNQKIEFFKNDEAAFLQKKQLFILNARLTDKIKSLHTKLKLITNSTERKEIAQELVEIDKQRSENWKTIDD